MSEEEKKAIERLIIYKDKIKDELYPIIDFEEEKAIGIVLNLIEKQSKEIEELKNGQIDFWISDKEIEERIRNKFVSKDKIKAKIEEYKKEVKKMEKDDIGIGFTLGEKWSDLKAKIEFGESLLEEDK